MFNGTIQVKKEVELHGALLLPNTDYEVWPHKTFTMDTYKVCKESRYSIPQELLRKEFDNGNIIIIKNEVK